VQRAFAAENREIADSFRRFGRCLMIIDEGVHELYGESIEDYFFHHGTELTAVPVRIAETDKSLSTAERMIDAFGEFGLVRTEPVLVVGGGLTTDVAGFACSAYRRSTNYVRVPTTLIGLIDASVAIKVAVNHGHLKNRLGAHHASQKVIFDFSFLSTLPIAQVRNGMAALVKIAVVGNRRVFDLLEAHGEELLHTGFGHREGSASLREVGREVTYEAIRSIRRRRGDRPVAHRSRFRDRRAAAGAARRTSAHGVLVMPGQSVDDREFVDFLRAFGDLSFTTGEAAAPGFPELNVVSNVGRATPPRSTSHVDTSYVRSPPAYTALRAVTIPAQGGETLFTNEYRAYETLPGAARRAPGAHDHALRDRPVARRRRRDLRRAPGVPPPPALGPHRAVHVDAEPVRGDQLDDRRGSDGGGDFLFAQSTRADNTYRHPSSAGDVVMWDNGCVLHRADHEQVVGDL
jgi:hypothetical protein